MGLGQDVLRSHDVGEKTSRCLCELILFKALQTREQHGTAGQAQILNSYLRERKQKRKVQNKKENSINVIVIVFWNPNINKQVRLDELAHSSKTRSHL